MLRLQHSHRSTWTADRPRRSAPTELGVATMAAIGALVASRTLSIGLASPDDVIVHLAALGAIVIGAWWLSNVAAWATALRRGQSLARYTLPGTRRVAQLVLAAALSISTAACSLGAAESPTMQLVAEGATTAEGLPADTSASDPPTLGPADSEPTTSEPTTSEPAIQLTTSTAVTASTVAAPSITSVPLPSTDDRVSDEIWDHDLSAPSSETDPTSSPPGSIPDHRVVVIEGDNLWTLSEQALIHHGIEQPNVEQVARYWQDVVAANHVRSGNPDLIVPGETVTMPAHRPRLEVEAR